MKTNRKYGSRGGFTLIELLVVIAIIGILASIILVSLNSARKKGSDTRVIADVQQIRDALETGYNGSAYPDLTNTGVTAATSNTQNTSYTCWVSNWTNAGPQNNAISTQANDACAQGGTNDIFINTAGTGATINAYAIYGKLVSNTSGYFCIDSTGKTGTAESSTGAITCQ